MNGEREGEGGREGGREGGKEKGRVANAKDKGDGPASLPTVPL